MKLQTPKKHLTLGAKMSLAETLSVIVTGHSWKRFIPYPTDPDDPDHWVLDSGNDWRLTFDADAPDKFTINYRYECAANAREEKLAAWLGVVISAIPCENAEVSHGDSEKRS